jgi:hypothetical protein
MEVAEEGVAIPTGGNSVLGVGTSLNVFGVVRASCDWIAAGVLAGNGGKADGAIADFVCVSAAITGFGAGFEGTEMFKIPAVWRFSFALVVLVTVGWLEEADIGFLFAAVSGVTLAGVAGLAAVGVATAFALPLSRAGKSSG